MGFARMMMSASASASASMASSVTIGTSPKLKLLGPSYTRAFRCLWMLEELQLKYELDEAVRPQSRAARQHSGAGKVPILLHYRNVMQTDLSPLVLTESLAINTYLGDTFGNNVAPDDTQRRAENTAASAHHDAGASVDSSSPHPPLHMPSFGTLDRVKYDQLVCCVLSELDAASLWVHHKHTSPELSKVFGLIPEVTGPCRRNFAKANRELAAQCRPYLLGGHFTPIDIAYVHCLEWAMREKWNDSTSTSTSTSTTNGEEWPAELLDPYLALCRDRPAYRRAQEIRKASLLELKRRQQQQSQQPQDRPTNPEPSEAPPTPAPSASKL